MKPLKVSLPIAAACLSVLMAVSPVFAVTPRASLPPKAVAAMSAARTKACEARASAVQTRLASLISLANNMLNIFDTHAQSVENYYTNTLVPSGKTVSNYSTLTADIDAKKKAVVDAWTKAKTDADNFSCTTGDARVLLNQFRVDMQATKQALQAYRVSIKNLIVAVRRVSPAATPSASPKL